MNRSSNINIGTIICDLEMVLIFKTHRKKPSLNNDSKKVKQIKLWISDLLMLLLITLLSAYVVSNLTLAHNQPKPIHFNLVLG